VGDSANSARAVRIHGTLSSIYPDARPLLSYRNPFELLIAVILSAQTKDAQVNRVTGALFSRFPTPAALAAAPREEVEEIVHSTGFYRSKARNIQGAATELDKQFNGKVPGSMDQLLQIPGVGRKSANVILGVVYGKPSIVVDTHFGRVVRRLELTGQKDPVRVEREIRSLVPEEMQTPFSMEINLHGRYCCTARAPRCEKCPIRKECPYPQRSR